MQFPLRAAIAAFTLLTVATPAHAQQPTLPADPAAWTTDNVEYLGSIQQDFGLTTGAKVVPSTEPGVPDKLFVTSGKNFTIYDISDPANPKTMGTVNESVAWEGEEVPTNGKVLITSTDYYSIGSPDCLMALKGTGCVQFWDVRDPANVKAVGSINESNHTSECALNCQYTYGSDGTIVDARGVLDGTPPTKLGNWITEIKKSATNPRGVNSQSCHHIRELRPGVLLTACQPFAVITIVPTPEFPDASPAHPKVLASGPGPKFVHSARWPRQGTDKFLMTGGELNFQGRCELNDSEFKVFNAQRVSRGESNTFDGPTDQLVPANGTYTDGNAPAGELGCSVHWFQEHPTFHNGGLVALSEYENGVKFLQITPDGKIKPVGYFISAGSSSSSPKWAPDGKTLYSIDYHRGLDILRWKGDNYVPNAQGKVKHKKGKVRGSSANPPLVAIKAARSGQAQLVKQLRLAGWFPGFCQLLAKARS